MALSLFLPSAALCPAAVSGRPRSLQAPAAPAPAAAPSFPKPDPANFTADVAHQGDRQRLSAGQSGAIDETVSGRSAILKTPVEGVSKVVVFVGDKSGKQKPYAAAFYALPDGKHIIAGDT